MSAANAIFQKSNRGIAALALVVTDDVAERETVAGLGGLVSSCANFIRMIENALTELQDELRNYNRTERNRFNQSQRRDVK